MFKNLIICLGLCTLSMSNALAESYPWVEMNSAELHLIADPQAEVVERLRMIGTAQQTIDLIIWDQRTDAEVGVPVLAALKEAANRGVRVRFLLSWSGHMMQDPFDSVGRYLKKPATKVPVDLVIAGSRWMRAQGWGYFDGIHQKLLVIDGREALVTGRGHADQYMAWMDTAVTFRGPLVAQSIQVFQDTWALIHQELGIEDASLKVAVPRVALAPLPISAPGKMIRVRTLFHDLLKQLKDLSIKTGVTPVKMSNDDRIRDLQDPVVNEMIRLVSDPNTKSVKFYSLLVRLHPAFKEALLEALKRGVKVQLFTNGHAAQVDIVPISVPFGWYRSLIDMDDLLQAGAQIFGLVHKGEGTAVYVHRKMAIVDDVVIVGSHNFNLSSTIESDEMSYEIVSKEFADECRDLFQKGIDFNGEEINRDDIHKERNGNRFQQWFADYLGVFY
jgi:phosphatidylserine/phosphatidylglycerophosphate/cardiolipin synthase-like enzyme